MVEGAPAAAARSRRDGGQSLSGGGDLLELFLARSGRVVGVVALLKEFALGEDVDGVPAAGVFAETAAGAILGDDDDLAEKVGC